MCQRWWTRGMRTRKSKVWRMLSIAESALGFFPFPQRWQCEAGPTWRHDAEAVSISLTARNSAVSQLFWLYCNMFSLRVFYSNLFGCCSWVAVFSQYASGEYSIQTFDRPTIQYSVQYYTCSGYNTIYSPYYCILIILFLCNCKICLLSYNILFFLNCMLWILCSPFFDVVSNEWSVFIILTHVWSESIVEHR